jgi:L-rhamnose mutarotase
LLKSSGISNYSIFINETANALVGVMKASSEEVSENFIYTSGAKKMVSLYERYYGKLL